jgi:hypothetical protein
VTALTLIDASSSRVPSSEGCVLLSPETLHANRLSPGQVVLVSGCGRCLSGLPPNQYSGHAVNVLAAFPSLTTTPGTAPAWLSYQAD